MVICVLLPRRERGIEPSTQLGASGRSVRHRDSCSKTVDLTRLDDSRGVVMLEECVSSSEFFNVLAVMDLEVVGIVDHALLWH